MSDESELLAKLRRVQAWILFVGLNILAILSGIYLWIDKPGRLPLLLGVIPILIVIIFILFWPNAKWNRTYLLLVTQGLGVLYGLYLYVHTRDWFWLLGTAFCCVLLFLRISALRKRIG
jgi:hypothetical protein